MESALDKGENIFVLFMNLSKAFDTINHDLLLAKLKAHGFSINALDLMCSYLKNRKQSVQINNSFSSTNKVHAGVHQGSIDGPLLFNLFINDSVLFLTDTFLSNYADDNNLYSIGKDILKNLLRKDFRALTEWFFKNYMVLNQKKCRYMCIGRNTENDKFKFDNLLLENSKEEVVLGVIIDNKLTFDSHIKSICRKAGQKLGALLRITNYLNTSQKKLIFSGMIKSQFSYCPLIWMFSSRKSNNLINRIHERSIRIVSSDNESNFENLLEKNKEITIHQRNLQILMIEVFKIINGYAPLIMDNFFIFRENTHNLRNFQIILNENKKTVRYGSETTSSPLGKSPRGIQTRKFFG